MKVLIGGGTGFIGRHLTALLRSKGHEVTLISRSRGPGKVTWDALEESMSLPQCDALVNLSGENVLNPMRRFDESFKRDLLDSRSGKNKLLTKLQALSPSPPSVWIASSAVGAYPTRGEFDENSPIDPPHTWMQSLVMETERSSQLELPPSVRSAIVRIGIVLGKDGGILQRSLLPFKFGLGGCLGTGQQWMPWIHVDDLARLFCYIIENQNASGVVNGVAPECVTNEQYTRCMAEVLSRPAFFHVPEFVLKALLSPEQASLILEGSRVLPKRTDELGFEFDFPLLKSALIDITR